MTHAEVYKQFLRCFPTYHNHLVREWFPNGPNSIRVRYYHGQEFVFSYCNKNYWRFETLDCFIKNELLKKGEERRAR